jgi:beta-lactamase regulating signal transducer with metallopeptidase domain
MNSLHVPADVASFAVVLSALAALLLIQSTFVLGIGLAVTRLLRPRGAAIESAGQRIVLTAALLAPLVSAVFGLAVARVRIPLPAFAEAAPLPAAESVARPPLANLTEQPLADRLMRDADRPERPPVLRPDTLLASSVTRIGQQHAATNLAAPRPAGARDFWLRVSAIAFCAAWLGIAAVLVIRLVVSLIGAGRLIAAAAEAEPELIARCGKLADQIGVRSPRLKRSPFVPGPCVFGWRRPVILLRESDAEVDDDVLIHELAHIARRDCFWKTLSEVAVALLCFQPLLWNLKSRMQICAEDVCDDFVVQFGTDRYAYADRLTRIAEELAARARELRVEQVGIGIVSFRSSLGRRVSRILDSRRELQTRTSRRTIAGLLCGAVAVVLAASLIDVGRPASRAAGAATDDVPSPASAGPNELTPAKEEHGDVVTVRGQVLRPDGRPAVGAKVSAIWYVGTIEAEYRPIASVITSPGGLFELVYRKSQSGKVRDCVADWKETTIEVDAEGCGVEWKYGPSIDAARPLVFKLSPDFPIHGRLVDLQGQPVAGVVVSVVSIWRFGNGTPDAWLDRFKGDVPYAATPRPGLAGERMARERTEAWAVTNQEGRFVVRGITAERLATLALRGETIRYTKLEVMTRNMPAITHGPTDFTSETDKIYGAEFMAPVDPGRTVAGTVRDTLTGKPLAGVTVRVWRIGDSVGMRDQRILTDTSGSYRLLGLPNGKGNRLLLVPGKDQPYLMREVDVPVSPGSKAINLDVQLHRGVWIAGRATNRVTGKPVICRVYYLPFRNNPFTGRLPEYQGRSVDGEDFERWTREDGTFRIVGLPGRAIVGGWVGMAGNTYRRGVGASEIQGMDKSGWFPTYGYFPAGRNWPDVLKEINPREGTEEVHCDLVFDPGQTIHVSLVDRNGKPVDGCTLAGGPDGNTSQPRPSNFDITNLASGEERPILIRQEKLQIGKFLMLHFTDKTPRSMKITLEPCALVKGRIVDQDGVGIPGTVEGRPRPGGDFWPSLSPSVSQRDGTFQVAVPPGCRYSLSVDAHRLGRAWVPDIAVEAGKTIDVGDVKIRRTK